MKRTVAMVTFALTIFVLAACEGEKGIGLKSEEFATKFNMALDDRRIYANFSGVVREVENGVFAIDENLTEYINFLGFVNNDSGYIQSSGINCKIYDEISIGECLSYIDALISVINKDLSEDERYDLIYNQLELEDVLFGIEDGRDIEIDGISYNLMLLFDTLAFVASEVTDQ